MVRNNAHHFIWLTCLLLAGFCYPFVDAAVAVWKSQMLANTDSGRAFLIRVADSENGLISFESTLQPLLVAITLPVLWMRSNIYPLIALLLVTFAGLAACYFVHQFFLDPEAIKGMTQTAELAEELGLDRPEAAKSAIHKYIQHGWEGLIAFLFLVIGIEGVNKIESTPLPGRQG